MSRDLRHMRTHRQNKEGIFLTKILAQGEEEISPRDLFSLEEKRTQQGSSREFVGTGSYNSSKGALFQVLVVSQLTENTHNVRQEISLNWVEKDFCPSVQGSKGDNIQPTRLKY